MQEESGGKNANVDQYYNVSCVFVCLFIYLFDCGFVCIEDYFIT